MKNDHLLVYVASAYEDWPRARRAMKTLREHDIDITYDWTIYADTMQPDGNAGAPEDRLLAAKLDMEGVRSCDVLLVLTPDSKEKGCGLWTELGGGLFLDKIVYCTGLFRNRSVFQEQTLRFETDEAAIAEIIELAKRFSRMAIELPAPTALSLASGCPVCCAPKPQLHPAMQHEGEVQYCKDPFHKQVTVENTQAMIDEVEQIFRESDRHE